MRVGTLVQVWHDTGAFGHVPIYGVVVRECDRTFVVLLERNRRTRASKTKPNGVEAVKPLNPHTARDVLASHGVDPAKAQQLPGPCADNQSRRKHMAITFEKIHAEMTLYYRFRQKMGNTTMSTLTEGRVSVVEVDVVARRFKMRTSAGEHWCSERDCGRYFVWSIYNNNEAVRHGSALTGRVGKVTRRKRCPKSKTRHASEACPPKETK